MSEFATAVVQTQMELKGAGTQNQAVQQTQNGRSFESVLQKDNSQIAPDPDKTVTQLSDPKLEAGRQDLMKRIQDLPKGAPKVSAIFPEYLNTKNQVSDFKSHLSNVFKSGIGIPKGSGIKGSLTVLQNEWTGIDSAMMSANDLSQGELLALQAGLYRVSQHIEVLSKVVDQMTSGVKTVLNTNI